MKKLTKTFASIIAISMVLPLAACSKTNKKDKAVIDAADTFAEALLSCDSEEVADLSDDADTDVLDDYMTFSSSKEDVCDAIIEGIEFKVDKKSVDRDDKKASVKVTFTMPDYEAVADDEDYENEDDIIDLLEEADTIDIEVTVKFKLNKDDEWVVTNAEDVAEEVFDFNVNYPFSTGITGNYTGKMEDMGFSVDLTLELRSDNTFTMVMDMTEFMNQLSEEYGYELTDEDLADMIESVVGVYSIDGDEICLAALSDGNVDELYGTIKGDMITLEDSGETIVFYKD